jgi:predicted aspartyl protease
MANDVTVRLRGAARLATAVAAAAILLISTAAARAQSRLLTEFDMDAPSVEVPFVYTQHQIVIKGQANGKKDLTLLFDTGASAPVFDASLGVQGLNFPDRVVQEADGLSSARSLLLDDIGIGQDGQMVHARNIGVLISDMSQVSKVLGRKIDGIVGLSFMSGYVIEIDYAKKALRFMSPRRFTVADRKPDNQSSFLLPLVDSDPKHGISNVLVSGALVSDYEYDFILDTGFGGYVSVARSAAELSGLLKNETPRIPAESLSVSHRFHSDKIRASYLMLGAINLSNRVIQVDTRNGDSYGQSGIIGNRLLQNYRLILDYPRRKLWLERATTKEEADDTAKPILGLTVRADGSVIRVVRVAPASPAAHAGVHDGDAIVRLDGLSVEDIGITTALAVLASPDGPTDVVLKRDGASAGENQESISVKIVPASPLDWHAE